MCASPTANPVGAIAKSKGRNACRVSPRVILPYSTPGRPPMPVLARGASGLGAGACSALGSLPSSLTALLGVPAQRGASVRDLAAADPWELSLGRSRARRRARELRFVPAGTRAKRISLGALVALSAGPAAGLADASGHVSARGSADDDRTRGRTERRRRRPAGANCCSRRSASPPTVCSDRRPRKRCSTSRPSTG